MEIAYLKLSLIYVTVKYYNKINHCSQLPLSVFVFSLNNLNSYRKIPEINITYILKFLFIY